MSGVKPFRPNLPTEIGSFQPQLRGAWRDELKIWWREIDKVLLALIAALMVIGTAAVAAASPATAERLSTADVQLGEFRFLKAHLAWQLMGLAVMFGASVLSRDNARRLGILLAAGMLSLLFLVPLIGVEVNGARRWIRVGMQFQPSEFLKPGFAIVLAWILTWRLRDPNLPVVSFVSIIMGIIAILLMMQPNLGATILFGGVWFVLILLSGVPLKRLGLLIGGGLAALTTTYFFYGNARNRIDSFFSGGTAFDHVDLAERTLLAGGWTGSGLWLGTRKMNLPEAHTDYIFSVIGEEFGLIICALVVLLYQIGGQAMINILVNLQLFPSKGMTLPLVSYGGSSTIAVCLTFGLLLAITRRNPFLDRETPGIWRLARSKEDSAE